MSRVGATEDHLIGHDGINVMVQTMRREISFFESGYASVCEQRTQLIVVCTQRLSLVVLATEETYVEL